MRAPPPLLFRVSEAAVGEELRLVAGGVVFGEGEVVFEIISALCRFRARDRALEVQGEIAGFQHEGEGVLRGLFAEQEEIAPRPAAHGSEVDDVGGGGRVAQAGGEQMFHGMQGCDVHRGFAVGRGEAQVEGGDGDAVLVVAPREVEPGQEIQVIYGETCYLFHNSILARRALPRNPEQLTLEKGRNR